jgi:hypothetical protein
MPIMNAFKAEEKTVGENNVTAKDAVDLSTELPWLLLCIEENKRLLEELGKLVPELLKGGICGNTLSPEHSLLFKELIDMVKTGGGNHRTDEYIARIRKFKEELIKPRY